MALLQQITYLYYYAHNCAKGGVFIQPCGWMGEKELWSGTVSDSQYQTLTEVFKMQHKFSQNDLVNGKVLRFTNILDKAMDWR